MKPCFHCGAPADIAKVVCRACIADIITKRTVMAFHRFLRPGEDASPLAERRSSRTAADWRSEPARGIEESDFGLWRVPVRHAGDGWRWTDPSEKIDETVVPIYAKFPAECATHDWTAIEHTKVCAVCGRVEGPEPVETQPTSPYLDLDFPYLQYERTMKLAELDGRMLDARTTTWSSSDVADLRARHERLLHVAPHDHIAREMLSAEIRDAAGALSTSSLALSASVLPFPRVVSPGAPIKAHHLVRWKDKKTLSPVPAVLVGRTVPRNIDPVDWVLNGWLVEITPSAQVGTSFVPVDATDVVAAFSELERGRIVQPRERKVVASMVVECEKGGHRFLIPETFEQDGEVILSGFSPIYCALCPTESKLRRVK